MISKELLNKVLDETYEDYNVIEIFQPSDVNCIGFIIDDNLKSVHSINIYELAHMCKEWALNFNSDRGGPVGGHTLYSRYGDKWKKAVCFCDEIVLSVPTQYADTEPEAIFKACQWILDNKDK